MRFGGETVFMNSYGSEVKGIALFIDLENLVGGASSAGIPIDMAPVITKLKELGPIRLRKGFGDLKKGMQAVNRDADLDNVRRMFHRNLVEMVDIPYMTAQKNTADMHLILDAISVAFQNPDISHYAILSSDRDYVPLFNKLREIGKTVIAIGVEQNVTPQMVRDASDNTFYYDLLVAPAAPKASTPEAEKPAFAETEKQNLEEYFRVLARALRALEEKGKKLVGSEVYQQMRAIKSDFQPQLAGCEGFKEFAVKARAVGFEVTIPDGPGDSLFAAPRLELIQKFFPVAASEAQPSEAMVKQLRESVAKILNLPNMSFPPVARRRRVLSQLELSYRTLMKDGPFRVSELAWDAHNALSKEGIDQPTIFKLALSLYFARCFQVQATESRNNPEIVGIAVNPEHWDDRLLLNLLRQSQRVIKVMTPQDVAQVIYDQTTPEAVHKAQQLIEEVRE